MSDQHQEPAQQAGIAAGRTRQAAVQAARGNAVQVNIEGLGSFQLPPPDELAFLAGVGTLAVLGIIEWPLAGVLAIGHIISRTSRNRALREFGEALESA